MAWRQIFWFFLVFFIFFSVLFRIVNHWPVFIRRVLLFYIISWYNIYLATLFHNLSRSSHSPESGVGSHASHTSLPDSEVERLYANAEAEIDAEADEEDTLNGSEVYENELLPVLGTCRALYTFEGSLYFYLKKFPTINQSRSVVLTIFLFSLQPKVKVQSRCTRAKSCTSSRWIKVMDGQEYVAILALMKDSFQLLTYSVLFTTVASSCSCPINCFHPNYLLLYICSFTHRPTA